MFNPSVYRISPTVASDALSWSPRDTGKGPRSARSESGLRPPRNRLTASLSASASYSLNGTTPRTAMVRGVAVFLVSLAVLLCLEHRPGVPLLAQLVGVRAV
jgi:hypothetical protein